VTLASTRGLGNRAALARCTDDIERFLAVDWGRSARVVSRADPSGFGDLLTLDDVDRFLTTTGLRTPFFRLVQAGERIAESAYTRAGRAGSRPVAGIVDPVAVASLFERGATIVLQAMHRWSEPVTRFCRELEVELGFPCQVNAYITPAGAQGLDLHHDPHDVFVLQAFGRKRWEVHAAPAEGERAPLDVEVEPGDTIYMPTGTPHAGSAQREVSGHLTVGVHVTTWRDAVAGAWESAIGTDTSLAAALPPGWHHDPGPQADELAARLRSAAERLVAVDARRLMQQPADRSLSSRGPLARGSIAEVASSAAIDDATVVRRRPGSVCEIRASDGTVALLLGDRRLEVPRWLEPAVRRLAEANELAVADLADDVSDAASRVVLVRRLIAEGLLTAEPVRDPDPSHDPDPSYDPDPSHDPDRASGAR
jgi:bifunctional lysine-specific demethylase and histidyl-hydroxylase NO66